MKDVPYPLDFVSITANGSVSAVESVPGVSEGTPDDAIPRFPLYGQFVITLPGGEAASDGFVVGQQVTGLPQP